nr:uncharacterized protein LOC116832522 isoform X3 [Chelonoidis abingdonii]
MPALCPLRQGTPLGPARCQGTWRRRSGSWTSSTSPARPRQPLAQELLWLWGSHPPGGQSLQGALPQCSAGRAGSGACTGSCLPRVAMWGRIGALGPPGIGQSEPLADSWHHTPQAYPPGSSPSHPLHGATRQPPATAPWVLPSSFMGLLGPCSYHVGWGMGISGGRGAAPHGLRGEGQ